MVNLFKRSMGTMVMLTLHAFQQMAHFFIQLIVLGKYLCGTATQPTRRKMISESGL
jgi:hypothetical protein